MQQHKHTHWNYFDVTFTLRKPTTCHQSTHWSTHFADNNFFTFLILGVLTWCKTSAAVCILHVFIRRNDSSFSPFSPQKRYKSFYPASCLSFAMVMSWFSSIKFDFIMNSGTSHLLKCLIFLCAELEVTEDVKLYDMLSRRPSNFLENASMYFFCSRASNISEFVWPELWWTSFKDFWIKLPCDSVFLYLRGLPDSKSIELVGYYCLGSCQRIPTTFQRRPGMLEIYSSLLEPESLSKLFWIDNFLKISLLRVAYKTSEYAILNHQNWHFCASLSLYKKCKYERLLFVNVVREIFFSVDAPAKSQTFH